MDVSFPALNVRFDLDRALDFCQSRHNDEEFNAAHEKLQSVNILDVTENRNFNLWTSNTSVFSRLHFINTVLPDGVYQTQ